MKVVDYAVIGGGVAGTYCAWRLKKEYPEKEVVLYERSNRIGGRLLSIKMPKSQQISELGGMRYRPEHHKLFSHLVSIFNLKTKSFPMGPKNDPDGDNNICYFRGKQIKVKELKDPQKSPFHLSSEHGISPDDLQRQIVSMFVPEWKSLTYEQWFDVEILGKKLWQWGFWNLLFRILSSEEYSFLKYGSGYDTNVSNGNSVVLLPTGQDYSPGQNNPYRTLVEGMDSLPKRLAEEFKKIKGKLETNLRLQSINKENKTYDLKFVTTKTLENERSVDLETSTNVKSHHVILAMPRASLESIEWEYFQQNEELKKNLNSVLQQGSVKILLEYPHAWWKSLGLLYGRSLTDLPIRQTMYFTSDDESATDGISKKPGVLMASYNDIETVPFWKGFKYDEHLLDGPELYKAPKSMVDEAHRQVTEIHGQRELPVPISAAYYDWTQEPYGAGWHCWKAGYCYKDILDKVRHPIKNENVYICGEAYSNDQGWAEGALETAELVLTDNLGMPPILPPETSKVRRSTKMAGYSPDPLRRLKY